MPIYEYECTECAERSELLVSHGDSSEKTCSVCGGSLRKLISAPSFQFKGSGWYVTDYGKNKSGGPDSSESSEKSSDSSSESSEKSSGSSSKNSGSDSSSSKSSDKGSGKKKEAS